MKIHLKTSDDPIAAGEDLTANCGQKLVKAALRFWFDLGVEDVARLNSVRICSECYATRTRPGTYLAGVVNGQESIA